MRLIRLFSVSILFFYFAGCTQNPASDAILTQPLASQTPNNGDQSPLNTSGIPIEEDMLLVPASPGKLMATTGNGNVLLRWLGTGDDRVKNYRIFRRNNPDQMWVQIDEVEAEGRNADWYEFEDTDLDNKITYEYGVTAVNTYGTESDISTVIVIINP